MHYQSWQLAAVLALTSTATAAPFNFPGWGWPFNPAPAPAPTHTPSSTTTPAPSATPAPSSSPSACKPQTAPANANTENGVTNQNCCTPLTWIFARGTGEGGNVGGNVGPWVAKALRAKLGASGVTIQGVPYPATQAGNWNLGGDGGGLMANLVNQALKQCPKTKVIVSGYSQGGLVTHNAFSAHGLSNVQVTGAAQFGDPYQFKPIGNLAKAQIKEYCAKGDTVCDGTDPYYHITPAHNTYYLNASNAADWMIARAAL